MLFISRNFLWWFSVIIETFIILVVAGGGISGSVSDGPKFIEILVPNLFPAR
jgi:hypothetical protein